jgi:hypothetical protein
MLTDWEFVNVVPVPFAEVFQKANTKPERSKEFGVNAVGVAWVIVSEPIEPVPPFGLNETVWVRGAVVIVSDTIEGPDVPEAFVAVTVIV